jgi:hydroxylamine dehydrogenase
MGPTTKQRGSLDATGLRRYQILFWLMVFVCIPWVQQGAETCVECHSKSSPRLVTSWQESRHAVKGVGCAACHGEDHSRIFEVKGEVSAAVCGTCHATQVKEFSKSLHAIAIDTMKADPKFGRLSPAMAELSCNGCHQIGKQFSDGSRGNCNSCNSGHSFSSREARRPESCAQCHTGPDHEHLEMWLTSKHGQLYSDETTRAQSPTCVTCHMPSGSHDTSVGLSLGNVAHGAALDTTKPPVKMRLISAGEFERQRESMLSTCLPCHSSRFSTESLSKADLVKVEADQVLAEAVAIIEQLHSDGLLKSGSSQGRSTNHIATSTNREPPLVLGGDQLYEGLSPIEQRFFGMSKFHHASTFKGAYHHSPLHTHNKGFLLMKQDLDFIKQEADRLRKKASGP